LAAPAKETARDRVLDDSELAHIVGAARQLDGPYGAIVELLALSGQRREEVAQLTWDELDLASQTWTLPSTRTKNGKPHIVHLSKEVITVLMRRPRLGRFVFSLSGGKPFQSFSAAKRELDRLSEVTGWRLHDLRRTCVSGMARLGVAPMSPIRSSITRPERSQVSPPCISATSFLQNVKKRWSVGVLTSPAC